MNKLLAALLVLGLSACASSGDTLQRYRLAELNQAVAPSVASEQVLLQLQSVRLASFISTPSLLYQTTDIAISEAQGHQWAEDIDAQLGRALRQHLTRSIPQLQVLDANETASSDRPDYRLTVRVERFQGRYDGMAVLSGDWMLRDHDGALLESVPYSIENVLAEDGYTALVRSLGLAWTELATRISTSLRERDARLKTVTPETPQPTL